MSRTDLVADAFTIIRNAVMARKDAVDIPASNMLKEVMRILKDEKYIEEYKAIDNNQQGILRVYLKYEGGEPAIINISKVSRPGMKTYVKHGKLPVVLRGRGIAIVSTSKGVMTNTQAKELGIGGEIIGYIW